MKWTEFTDIEAERILEGSPQSRLMEISRTEQYSAGQWEVTEGRFTVERRGGDEVIHILAGEGVLHSEDGTSRALNPGVSFVMEEGFRGQWDIRKVLRKFYTQVTL